MKHILIIYYDLTRVLNFERKQDEKIILTELQYLLKLFITYVLGMLCFQNPLIDLLQVEKVYVT